MAGINEVLRQELERIKISEKEKKLLDKISKLVTDEISSRIRKLRIDANVFIGGSLAKNTLIKKNKYDVDIFVRFSKKYSEEEIKKYMKKIFTRFHISGHKIKGKMIHGSRDYFRFYFKINKNMIFEVVPSLDIKSPEEARNITDLSYFHVNYIKKELKKNKKLADEILLAKSFCHGQKCYGAESYILGFSGYTLELLVIYYKSFSKFLKEIIDAGEQIVIDSAKQYKNKEEILKNLNIAKIKEKPVILVDPTFKERNAATALSMKTFNKFRNSAKRFLENPSGGFFEHKKADILELRQEAMNLCAVFAVFEIKTKRQPGDIAGSKLLKFSKLLSNQIAKYFDIEKEIFEYDEEKRAHIYFILKRKKENIHGGPSIHNHEAVEGFKKKHKIWYVDDGRIKCTLPTDISIKEFLKQFKKTHKKTIKEMGIRKVKIV